jgi:hypothetical protein
VTAVAVTTAIGGYRWWRAGRTAEPAPEGR